MEAPQERRLPRGPATEIQRPPLKDTSDNLLTDTHDKIQLLTGTHVMRKNVQDIEAPSFLPWKTPGAPLNRSFYIFTVKDIRVLR